MERLVAFLDGHAYAADFKTNPRKQLGIILTVTEGNHKGSVPLADLRVTPASDRNLWPVREYVVWHANR